MPHIDLVAEGKVWLYDGPGGWHFVTLPEQAAAAIRDLFAGARSGWGSVRVKVTVGKTTWETSVFPDKRSGSYVLPIKKAVREAEKLTAGKQVRFTLAVDV